MDGLLLWLTEVIERCGRLSGNHLQCNLRATPNARLLARLLYPRGLLKCECENSQQHKHIHSFMQSNGIRCAAGAILRRSRLVTGRLSLMRITSQQVGKLVSQNHSAHRLSSSSSSTRWKSRQGRDSFAREAKVQGLKSRAAFKLLEVGGGGGRVWVQAIMLRSYRSIRNTDCSRKARQLLTWCVS